MFYTDWEILVVDDEPDVLSISKLAMSNFDVYGLPLKISTAQSKAEALELLNPYGTFSPVSVAFIDVVMEHDSAGLELCQAIREQMHNHLIQLFIRTGQPGIAPERTVIDNYDINGYFTKAEATEDKLYSLVKSGVRQHMVTSWAQGAYMMLNNLIANNSSREQLAQAYRHSQVSWDKGLMKHAPELGKKAGLGHGLMIDDQIINTGLWTDETAVAQQIARLSKIDGIPLNSDGDQYIRDDEHHQLVKIAAQDSGSEVNYYFSTAFKPPMPIIMLVHNYFKSLGTLWQQAA